MKETRINENVIQKVSDNGEIKYWKKAKYNMNLYYTKLAENIYDQLGVKYAKNSIIHEGTTRYLVTEDIKKDNEFYLGKDITHNTDLSKIKDDLKNFLINKEISEENIQKVWNDFLKMITADIYTSHPDRHGENWGILIKGSEAELAPNFDYDYTFSQNEYAMKSIAEAVENEDKSMSDKIMQKYNVRRFTGYLKNTIDHIGLHIGHGKRFLVDMETEKYSFNETSKYIQKELGEKEYSNLINKVDIQKALPEAQKDNEIYSLLAQLHSNSISSRIVKPNDIEQER